MYGLNEIGYATLVVSILFTVLATVAVVARLLTRRVLRITLGADDWLIILGLIAYYGYTTDALFGNLNSPLMNPNNSLASRCTYRWWRAGVSRTLGQIDQTFQISRGENPKLRRC